MKLVSACLCGVNCKYNGKNNLNPRLLKLIQEGELIPVCPEQLGGLPTPRTSAEILAASGQEVLSGKAQVITRDGMDVTEYYLKGAYETLKIARLVLADTAILKSRSPSCGSNSIYDGSFTHKIREADGVTAALLKKNGLTVIDEEEYIKGRV